MQILVLGIALRVVEVDDTDTFLVGRGPAGEVGDEVGEGGGCLVNFC